jgi:hypothetical protein
MSHLPPPPPLLLVPEKLDIVAAFAVQLLLVAGLIFSTDCDVRIT